MRLYDARRRVRSRPWYVLAAAVAIATIAPLAASAQSPTIEEFASDAATSVVVNDFAGNGSAAAGARTVFSGGRNVQQATRWNEAGGLTNLLDLGAHPDGRREGYAYAISGDGSVAVGSSVDWEGSENKGAFAVRWDPSGAPEKLNSMESASNGRPTAIALFVSADGTRVAGRASRYNGNGGPFLGTDAILWTGLTPTPLANQGGIDASNWRNADATGISSDGSIVAGYWSKYAANKAPLGIRPVKWTADGAATELPTLGVSSGGVANAKVHALSKNGTVVFGYSEKYDATGLFLGQVPVYWDLSEVVPVTHVVHEIVVPGTNGVALFCSQSGDAASGTYVGAGGSPRGFYWTPAGAVDLGTLRVSGTGQCVPRDFSFDGRTIVGFATTDDARGGAFIRQDGVMSSLWSLLQNQYQLDPAAFGWKQLDEALFCSADGTTIFGRGTKTVGGSAFFRVTLPSNAPPTIESSLVAGQTYDVPLGSTFTATFSGEDEDGDDLALEASGLPASAVLTPSAGTSSPAPTTATLTFAPVEANVGDHPATIAFRDEAGETASISFTLRVPANAVPSVTAPAPIVVECEGEQNLVTLSTTVNDADAGHLLTVAWSVGGQLAQTDVDVVPGSTVEFEHDYPHGESIVTVDVTDGYDQATASSAVTVQDTTVPLIVLAGDVIAPTDPGKDFATIVLLPPQVFDVCDEEPTLTSDAPEVYPVGDTLVTWTAVDEFLNVATVTQLVTVKDLEAPNIVGGADVTVPVDQGEIFATVDLPEPEAFDNVTADVAIESDAPATFCIGDKVVTWTARDEAGNEATWSLKVTVVNQAPVADAGEAVSVEASSAAGATVSLDGTGSFDEDGHDLLYSWSAPGITFDDPTSPTPDASFPVGETHVTLVVTDEADASDSAETVVTVTYDPVQSVIETRTYGPAASAFVAQSRAAIASLVAREPRNAFLAAALQAANQAAAYDAAAAAIEFEDASDYPAALQMYRVLRSRQAQASAAAATAVLMGRLISRPNGASDAEFAAAFQAATNATLYGLADATQP